MPFGFKNSHVIKKVIKNNNEDIIAYSLENGEIVMKEEAVSMAYQGMISGVKIEKDDNGDEYIKSIEEDYSDNLIDMPNLNTNKFQ
ncbi:Protein of unknown function [Clostridium acidisoli DSM 12555]|jgi:hypothetical protein|uniref:DUF3892 domain-containing protein n=1 Tax=Clostridium acidisoli DSM 12555 TaxID=1121291 RepID=A0A1W1XML3_9CLOT|nr:DUF3892 domain-containing protein [Clostridium acidisoli]SMC24771.1 Protein of unknown function [Clostridium acidisoli DSM 12555]